MLLGLVSKILYCVDVGFLISKKLGMIDPEVLNVRDIKNIVASPVITIDNTIGDNFSLSNRE